MALPMTPIFTQTIGAGGAAQVVFNNIPQFYTDLKIVISSRSSSGYGAGNPSLAMKFLYNGDTSETLYSSNYCLSTGAGRYTGAAWAAWMVSGNAVTTNAFGSIDAIIPNYSGSAFKSISTDSAVESNEANGLYFGIQAQLYRSTSPITSIKFVSEMGNFVQHSTFSLYGIIRPGA